MYMYYLLSYQLFGQESEAIFKQLKDKADKRNDEDDGNQVGHYGTIFKYIEQHMIEQVTIPDKMKLFLCWII